MATSDRAAWETMQSKLMALGYAKKAVIGEPHSGMQSGTVAIIAAGGEPDETTLAHPRETHRVNIRMYQSWLDQPPEKTEFLLEEFRAKIWEDICGDFDIGGNVAYIQPTECSWDFDVAEVEGKLYRIVDILIAYRIDDNAPFVK